MVTELWLSWAHRSHNTTPEEWAFNPYSTGVSARRGRRTGDANGDAAGSAPGSKERRVFWGAVASGGGGLRAFHGREGGGGRARQGGGAGAPTGLTLGFR